MNRRDLFKAFAAISAVGVSVQAKAEPRKYGRLTVDGHRAHRRLTGENLHVYVDGVEVADCYEADDVEGYALKFCRDREDHRDLTKRGKLHVGGDGAVCRMRLTGDVRIVPGELVEPR